MVSKVSLRLWRRHLVDLRSGHQPRRNPLHNPCQVAIWLKFAITHLDEVGLGNEFIWSDGAEIDSLDTIM